MNKRELAIAIHHDSGTTTIDAAEVMINSFIAVMQNELAKGGKVELKGFGTFSVKERAARTGRNPQTGEEIQIAASKLPSFKAGKALKDAVK